MSEVYAGKCIYCRNEIFYRDGETVVKCEKCGEKLVIAKLLNEKLRMDAALAEGEKARKALHEAEAERDQAREQLLQTVTTIEQLQDGQEESREKLKQVLQKQNANQETQKAALTLLSNLYAGHERNQDILTSLLSQVMSGQKTAEEKLYTLQSVAKKISNAQDDIGTFLQDIKEYLSKDTRIRNQQIGDLVTWAQSIQKEDVRRLEAISMSAGELAIGQKELNQQISKLQGAVTKTEQAVRGFEKKWQQSELSKLTELYHQAENYQLDREYEEAEKKYREVLTQGGKDPEVYWRILLCHYCVVFQTDNEGNRILTILYPDQTDPAEMTLWKELKNCEQTPEQREHYQREMAKLEQVIRKYREVRFDRQYDVFISVKQAVWQDGRKFYTTDCELGKILYNHLTEQGLKVFNSEVKDCKCPPGQEWEPYILAALLSSKVMIVVGSCSEYMESQWVKNEWQRYQWLQKKENEKGKSERKLLCYISDSMNPYDIPQGLNPDHQAIINNANAFIELDTALKEVFPNILPPGGKPPKEELSLVLDNMQAWLKLGQFDSVLGKYNRLVAEGQFLDSCTLHLYALCGAYRTKDIKGLENHVKQFLQDERFQWAKECAKTEQERREINELIEKAKRGSTDPSNSYKLRTIIITMTILMAILFIGIKSDVIHWPLWSAPVATTSVPEATIPTLEPTTPMPVPTTPTPVPTTPTSVPITSTPIPATSTPKPMSTPVANLPMIGAGIIENGNTVWFGQYNGNPILWRVLADGTDDRLPVSGKDEALLISENILDSIQFNPNFNAVNANQWFGSEAQNWCTSFLSNWPDYGAEKAAIKLTSVTESNDKTAGGAGFYNKFGAAPLSNESFFFLSAQEADTYFASHDDRIANEGDLFWWLRSPYADSSFLVAGVDLTGTMFVHICGESGDVRPAFNLNLSSILFSSSLYTSETTQSFKLTLLEEPENLKISISDGETVTITGPTIKIPYSISGARAVDTTKVYALVLDKEFTDHQAMIKEYIPLTTNSEGIGKYLLCDVDETWRSNYHLYIVAINESGSDYISDTASVPLEVPFT